MTRQRTTTTSDERSDGTARASDVSVTMIATPGDASCGIGTYGRDLRSALEDGQARADGGGATAVGTTTDLLELEQDEPTARHFLGVALRAAASDSDVVHVQHEYGLFRRPGSVYPGLFGLLFFPVLWLATRIRRQSIVVTLHSVLTPDPEEARFSKRLYLLVSHELIARVADHVIFLSEDCEERFHEDVAQSPGEYSVLPHGVNVRDASSVDRETAKERFGFDRDDRVVAIPGFIRPPKGHDVFVEIARELPDVEFLIAGGARPKGFDQGFVEEIEADAPENVTITGVLDDEDFPVALAAADLALLPYRVVTQSGTFNWCAAQELPILASDRSYFERIASEWDAVETVGLDDVETIADRVEALLADDVRRAELSRHVRQFKEANSFETVAAEHLAIYWSTLGGPAPHRGSETADASTTPTESEPALAACSAQREAPATSD
jgi:glycosyltransferase involved in cell wall biosynthesis